MLSGTFVSIINWYHWELHVLCVPYSAFRRSLSKEIDDMFDSGLGNWKGSCVRMWEVISGASKCTTYMAYYMVQSVWSEKLNQNVVALSGKRKQSNEQSLQ